MRLLRLFTCIAVALGASAAVAQSGNYPDRPIRLVATFPAGGTNDFLARLVAAGLQSRLGKQVVVDNRTGANGMIGTDQVAKAKGDPYTLTMGGGATHGLNPALYSRLPYDAVKDFTPIGMVASVPVVLIASGKLPIRNLAELKRYAKAHPQTLGFGSSGTGGTGHVAGEKFKQLTAMDLVHVPYKGDAPAVTDVMGGQVPLAFVSLTSIMPYLQTDRLHVIAVALPKRSDLLPKAPTFKEAGVDGMVFSTWYALMAPAQVPDDIVQRLSKNLNEILEDPSTASKLAAQGADVVITTPAATASFVKSEIAKYKKVVAEARVSVE